MANTTIQLKYSTVTATPTALNIAEPAYSYTSNTLFIGSPDGTGVIAVGGKFYLNQQSDIYNLVNAAFSTANNAGSGSYNQASFAHANAAFDKANTNASDITVLQAVNVTQNTSISNLQAVDLTQNTNITTAQTKADNAFNQANAAYAQANTSASDITVLQAVNLTQNTNITNAQNSASAAYTRANNSINANTGGTITGPLTITGNLIVQGTTTYVDSTTVATGDSFLKLANNNTVGDAVDIGFYGLYNDGSNKFAGLARSAGSNNFFLFKGLSQEPSGNALATGSVTAANAATLIANVQAYSVTIGGQDIQTYATNAYNQANTAVTNAGTAQTKADNAFNQANAAYAQANTNATAITNLQAVNVTQNTSITNIQAVDNTQNTNITTAQNKADSAFIQANAAFDKANTDATNINISAADYGSASAVASFKVEANGRISSANTTSIAIATSQITSGTLGVTRGGTGAGSFTQNGVLLGQGTNALTTASSSTEGHVLTINASGVPTFAHLSGGTF